MNNLERREIAIPFGYFDMRHPKSISRWQPNEKLAMTADEQLMHNLKHGYLDENYSIVRNEERIEFLQIQ